MTIHLDVPSLFIGFVCGVLAIVFLAAVGGD